MIQNQNLDGMVKALAEMSQLRLASIQNRGIDENMKLAYLNFASQLALDMNQIDDEIFQEKIRNVTRRAIQNSTLLNYDPMQDGYWEEKEPAFLGHLDDVLDKIIAVANIFTVNSGDIAYKHHIFQAIKHLHADSNGNGTNSKRNGNRKAVLGTIKPYGKALPLDSEQLRRFSDIESIEPVNDITVKINGYSKNLVPLLKYTSKHGYKYVRVFGKKEDIGKNDNTYRNIPAIRVLEEKVNETAIEQGKMNKFVHYLIKGTFPVSDIILGSLPLLWREKIAIYAKPGISKIEAQKYISGKLSQQAEALYLLYEIAGTNLFGLPSTLPWYGKAILVADIFLRMNLMNDKEYKYRRHGINLLEIANDIFHKLTKKQSFNPEGYFLFEIDASKYFGEKSQRQISAERQIHSLADTYFDKIVDYNVVNQGTQRMLVYSFNERVQDLLKKNIDDKVMELLPKEALSNTIPFTVNIHRPKEDSICLVYTSLPASENNMQKYWGVLFFMPWDRYLIKFDSADKGLDFINFAGALVGLSENRKKIEDIAGEYGLKNFNMRKYKNGKQIDEFKFST